jgi:hypothetical protein
VAHGLTDSRRPKGNHRNAAAIATFHGFAHSIWLSGGAGEMTHVVLAPVVARPLKRPQVVRLRLSIDEFGAEAVLLLGEAIHSDIG